MKNLIIFVLGVFSALLVGFCGGCGVSFAAYQDYEVKEKTEEKGNEIGFSD